MSGNLTHAHSGNLGKWYIKWLTTNTILVRAAGSAPTKTSIKGIHQVALKEEDQMNEEQIDEYVKALQADPRRMKFLGKSNRSTEVTPSRDHHFDTMVHEIRQF